MKDLAKTAERETYEELGEEIKLEELVFFDKVEFEIPDGRKAIANKFITRIISGMPKVNEPERFSEYKWIAIKDLENYPTSPDLKLLLEKIKEKWLQD